MTSLTELLQNFPTSHRMIVAWASTIPCMIADTEQTIQEKAIESFDEVVLSRAKDWESVEAGDPALWFLLTKLDFGADVGNATRRICYRLSKKSGISKKLVTALQSAVETKEFSETKTLRVRILLFFCAREFLFVPVLRSYCLSFSINSC